MRRIYVDNNNLFKMLKEYKVTKCRKLLGKISEDFLKISKNLLYKPNFASYSEDIQNDMLSDSLLYMFKYIDKYDLMYGENNGKQNNPFSYFTMIAWNAFVQCINRYHKHSELFVRMPCIEGLGEEGKDEAVFYKVDQEFIDEESKKMSDFFQG